ncbi:MAG: hypothetical protein HYX99_04065, partial [Chloroflexi bacterium]|nr:hypothetical protein [Chloroflexota bacterium]
GSLRPGGHTHPHDRASALAYNGRGHSHAGGASAYSYQTRSYRYPSTQPRSCYQDRWQIAGIDQRDTDPGLARHVFSRWRSNDQHA